MVALHRLPARHGPVLCKTAARNGDVIAKTSKSVVESVVEPAPIDPPGGSIEFLGPAIFPAHTTPTTALAQTSLIAGSETAGKRNISQNSLNQTDVHALLGPGPLVGLGKMQIMRWAAQNSPKDPQVSFAGKTVLVTGSNTGWGSKLLSNSLPTGASS